MRHVVRRLAVRAGLAGLAVTFLCPAGLEAGQQPSGSPPPVPTTRCSTAGLNREDCLIVLDREQPSTPLPINVSEGINVWVRVGKRQLESVEFDVAMTDVALPDPLGEIFGAFIAPLKALVFDARVFEPADLDRAREISTKLQEIHEEQKRVEKVLQTLKARIDNAGTRLRNIRVEPVGWTEASFAVARVDFVCAVNNPAPGTGTPLPACANHAAPGIGVELLPAGSMAALDVAIEKVTEDYAGLSADEQKDLTELLNVVASNQLRLAESFKSMQTAQDTLRQAAAALEKMTSNPPYVERRFVVDDIDVGRQATIKVSVQDVLTKAATPLATITVRWGGTRWELSTGAIFTGMPNRSFANTPIIRDGAPVLDASGKISTVITETVTRPQVVPIVLAHYRLRERFLQEQRFALLLTGGVGISPYSGSADFALGFSLAYRGLMISPIAHWGRSLRLTNGLQPGQELGSSPPALTTERHWRTTGGVGLSWRLPFK